MHPAARVCTQWCEMNPRALLALACERACGPDADPAWAVFTAPEVAGRIRGERRAAALRRPRGSHEAYEARLRRPDCSFTYYDLLVRRLDVLRARGHGRREVPRSSPVEQPVGRMYEP